MIDGVKPYPEYKDSGVPWMGEVPAHWEMERAKWLFEEMQRPVRPDDETVTCFRDGVVTLRKNRRTSGFTESLKEIGYQGVRRGDLVIHAMDAFAGATGVSDSDGKCTPVYAVCQPKRALNTHFYAFIVREMARTQYIVALSRGVRQRSTDFRFNTFADQEIPVPPFDEQQSIATFLLHIDQITRRYIREQRRLIELLEEQKQTLIQRAVTRGLDPDVPLKDSGIEWLEEIPEHWRTIRVGILADSLQTGPFGSQLHSYEYKPNGIPVINPSHMKDGKIFPDTNCAIGPDKADQLSRHRLEVGDIVFARRGELGRCALIGHQEVGWICGTGSLRMRLKDEDLADPAYLVQLFLSKGVAEWFSLRSVGSTMENLNTGILSKLPLPLPPKSEQQVIVEYIAERQRLIDTAIAQTQRQIDLVREYRTRLIADVVTGKLDVRGVVLPDPGPDDGNDFDDLDEIEDEGDMDNAKN